MASKNKTEHQRDISYYLGLPWTLVFVPDPADGGFVAKVAELRGCLSQGDTLEEAHEMIIDALKDWLEVALAHGDVIPQPGEADSSSYSGKFNVRVPRHVHRGLAEAAEQDGVSLNLFVATALAEAIARRESRGAVAAETTAQAKAPGPRKSRN